MVHATQDCMHVVTYYAIYIYIEVSTWSIIILEKMQREDDNYDFHSSLTHRA